MVQESEKITLQYVTENIGFVFDEWHKLNEICYFIFKVEE